MITILLAIFVNIISIPCMISSSIVFVLAFDVQHGIAYLKKSARRWSVPVSDRILMSRVIEVQPRHTQTTLVPVMLFGTGSPVDAQHSAVTPAVLVSDL